MKQIAKSYQQALEDHNVHFEQDLIKQLNYTINCVFDSWDSERAKVYREHMQIANDWGTAVIVQKMILGNLNDNSGTGVVFTQNPLRERPAFISTATLHFAARARILLVAWLPRFRLAKPNASNWILKGIHCRSHTPKYTSASTK
jgi:hypothetical protein